MVKENNRVFLDSNVEGGEEDFIAAMIKFCFDSHPEPFLSKTWDENIDYVERAFPKSEHGEYNAEQALLSAGINKYVVKKK